MLKKLIIIGVLVLGSIAVTLTLAQQNAIQEIGTFGTWMGDVTAEESTDTYLINIDESQMMGISVLPLDASLIPDFAVYDSQGNQLPIIGNALGDDVDDRISFPSAGQYRVEVTSQFETNGEYIINTRKLNPYTENSVFIPTNSMVSDTFADNSSIQQYTFTADTQNISTVMIYGEDFEPGVVANIRNLNTSEDVGVINAPAKASIYCLPAGIDNYAIEVTQKRDATIDSYNVAVTTDKSTFCNGSQIESLTSTLSQFTIDELNATDPSMTDTTLIGLENPELPPGFPPFPPEDGDPVCTAGLGSTSNSGNVRSLPSVTATVSTVVEESDVLGVLGQTRRGSWVKVGLLDGTVGYASASILDLADLCANVDIPFLWSDEDSLIRLELDAGVLDLADIQAALSLDGSGLVVTADGTIIDLALIDVDGIVGSDGITLNADVTADNIANVNADASVNSDGIQVNADAGVDNLVDVNADASVGNDGIHVDVNTDDIVDIDATVDVDDDGINVGVDLGDDDDSDDIGVNVGDDGIDIDLPGDGLDINLGGD